jgi:hypothetical protein
VATPRPRQPKPAPPRAGLSPEEKQRIEDHLTVTEPKPATGSGATQVPKVFKGLRAHAARGGPTLLLRNCDLRSLLEGIEQEEAEGVEFHCCTKTFGRAVASAAEHTPMLEPVGKRWRVLGGDQLLEKLNASEDEPEASSTGAGPAPPAMEPQPVVEPPSSSTTPPRARCELDHAFPGGATRELDHAREFAPAPAPPFRAAREFDRGPGAGRITDACQPGAGTSLAYRGPTGARG